MARRSAPPLPSCFIVLTHPWAPPAPQEDLKLLKLFNAELRRHHAEEVRSLVDNEERFQHAIELV